MSIDALRWALERRDIRPADKLLLISLADRANERHECWPSISRLSDDTGLNRKTIQACLLRLESGGLLRRAERGGATNVYVLVGVADRHATQPKNGPPTAEMPIPTVPESALTAPENSAGAEPENALPTQPKNGPPTDEIVGAAGGPKTGQGVAQKRAGGWPKNGPGGSPKTGHKPVREPVREPNTENSANAESSVSSRNATPDPGCPHLEIIALYNALLPTLPQVLPARWSGTRERNLRARWQEDPKHQDVRFWRWLFGFVAKQRFYLGENDRGWRADLGWLLEKRNFDRMLERAASAQRSAAA